jgi:hypothetical protein
MQMLGDPIPACGEILLFNTSWSILGHPDIEPAERPSVVQDSLNGIDASARSYIGGGGFLWFFERWSCSRSPPRLRWLKLLTVR